MSHDLMIRVGAAVLALVVLVVIIQRRRSKSK